VYVDAAGTAVAADGSRPDIASLYPAYADRHGFDATVPAPVGTRQVCAYAINTKAGVNALLGCRVVSVTATVP
jgi:hypothetical protein